MIRSLIRYSALVGAVAIGGCSLDVQNPNNPETDRVLEVPKDVEALLGSYYTRWHQGLYGSTASVYIMSMMQSFESYSSLSNDCRGQRVGIPRSANDNSIGNPCATEQQRVYLFMSEVNRVASNVLEKLEEPGFTLGSPQQNLRAKAFGEFLRGVSLGYLALTYDSAAVTSPTMDMADTLCVPDRFTSVCTGKLRHYTMVLDSAFAALGRALTYTNDPVASLTGGFPLPTTWIPSPTSFTAAEFDNLIRSYRARFRANVARTPAERAAVNWTEVINDAQSGITADHLITTNTVTGPTANPIADAGSLGLRHQMTPFIAGMADVSGAYESWIAQPLAERGQSGNFFMVTPDLRFPQGSTRALQQADFTTASCSTQNTPCKRYFRNRSAGDDQFAGNGWGWSNYDWLRNRSWRIAGLVSGQGSQNGPIPFFTKVELDMLEAEGHIRAGNFAAAATLINRSRTRGMSTTTPIIATGGGLPAVTATADGGLTMPNCVPKKPSGSTVGCGDLMEAMKWEKRMEAILTHFAGYFNDMRGWGDLPEGTPLQWATPYQELLSRQKSVYGMGLGTTGGNAAAKGTYGW
jgi:hypothetical protein